jgi:tetraacyldisaccharide 4'-kinase
MRIVDLRKFRPLGETGAAARAVLLPVLYPASAAYGAIAGIRRSLCAAGPDVGAPVIGVGSVLVGGTGKTPLCMLAASELARLGRRVCVVSRGYRRKSRTSPLVVSDGTKIVATVEEAGDEPYLMAKKMPGVPVVVDRDRARAARIGLGRLGADVIVLDDGFQTRSIRKSLEIVCLDAASLASRQYPLPLGRLREDWSAIRPEHVVVVVVGEGEPAPSAAALRGLGAQRVLTASRRASRLAHAGGGAVDPGTIAEGRWLVLSAIARPEAFEQACTRLGLSARVGVRMDDHHWYSRKDADLVTGLMRQHGCSDLVTTEKDFYRLPQALMQKAFVVRERIAIEDQVAFEDMLLGAMGMR